jgi:cellulose synthase/poly-beta-1,6-N-acetylglucosamine synthase-like glycosyltransferase
MGESMRALFQAVFILSVAFSLYTLAGYPLLLALVARFHARPVRKSYEPKSVTVLLPVRNGEPWLRAKLESLLALRYPAELQQILVISDGSSDGTEAIAAEFAGTGRIELLRTAGGGKAEALNVGMERARGEILFFTDVRQPLEPDSLRNLVACFADASVGAASGELVIREGATLEELSLGLYWKYETWLRKRESRIDSVMGATGCIYALRRSLATRLPAGTLVDDMFLPLAAFFAGYRVILEESAKAFDYPTALESEFRRKVRTQAGVYQIIRLYPRLLTFRNRMWFAFLSHKLARLLLPFALLLAAATTFALDGPWRTPVLLAQALFYAAALFDLWIPDDFPAKRLSAPLRSFVVLLAAAFCAAFVRSSETVWAETRVRPARP